MQQKVVAEREKYQYLAQSETAVSAVPHFSMNDRFALSRDDASYTLSIEVQNAIDTVLLQVIMDALSSASFVQTLARLTI